MAGKASVVYMYFVLMYYTITKYVPNKFVNGYQVACKYNIAEKKTMCFEIRLFTYFTIDHSTAVVCCTISHLLWLWEDLVNILTRKGRHASSFSLECTYFKNVIFEKIP